MPGKVLLGLSGGVDSSTSAFLLQRDGYDVVAVTLLLCATQSEKRRLQMARKVCAQLEIEHHVLDRCKQFKCEIEDWFVAEYAAGHTANPCPRCTRDLKLPLLFELATKYDCEKVALGSYAAVTHDAEGVGLLTYQLRVPYDRYHDETYHLYGITQEMLSRIIFPLANIAKPVVRRIAMRADLMISIDAGDGLDVCFLERHSAQHWLEGPGHISTDPGEVVLINTGVPIGTHRGMHPFDIGSEYIDGPSGKHSLQSDKLYVVAKDIEHNRLLVGQRPLAAVEQCLVRDVNWVSINPIDTKRSCRVRYAFESKSVPAQLVPTDAGIIVSFNEGVYGVHAGQACVFYSDDLVLGGGVIVG